MRYGFFSDIHSNLPALEAVIASMDNCKVERRICLGDLVGYGADVESCIARIREVSDLCLLGNHDSVAIGRESGEYFNQYARKAIEWTRDNLSQESRDYLGRLPYIMEEGPFCLAHASPKSPADWHYIVSLDEAVDAFDFFTAPICLVGHTHKPVIVVLNASGEYLVLDEYSYRVREGERVLVNVGSVGQPRDRDSRACWCLVDSETLEIQIIRISYSIDMAQASMRAQGFPPFLIQRLGEGR